MPLIKEGSCFPTIGTEFVSAMLTGCQRPLDLSLRGQVEAHQGDARARACSHQAHPASESLSKPRLTHPSGLSSRPSSSRKPFLSSSVTLIAPSGCPALTCVQDNCDPAPALHWVETPPPGGPAENRGPLKWRGRGGKEPLSSAEQTQWEGAFNGFSFGNKFYSKSCN